MLVFIIALKPSFLLQTLFAPQTKKDIICPYLMYRPGTSKLSLLGADDDGSKEEDYYS